MLKGNFGASPCETKSAGKEVLRSRLSQLTAASRLSSQGAKNALAGKNFGTSYQNFVHTIKYTYIIMWTRIPILSLQNAI